MWMIHALNMLIVCLLILVTIHLSNSPQVLLFQNIKEEYSESDPVVHNMTTETNQVNINLPGGGFVFRAKVGVEINADKDVEKL